MGGSLKTMDDLFRNIGEPSAGGTAERIPTDTIDPHPKNPYGVRDTPDMARLVESVGRFGVLEPVVVRTKEDGRYELLSGERRLTASRRNGLPDIPATVVGADDDKAEIMLADFNIKREDVLPSERAKACKMKQEAVKRLRKREGATLSDVAESEDVSLRTIHFWVKIADLIPELSDCLDRSAAKGGEKNEADKHAPTLTAKAAYSLASLSESEQRAVCEAMVLHEVSPSPAAAEKIRKLSESGTFDEESLLEIIRPREDFKSAPKITLKGERLTALFPEGLSGKEAESEVFRMIEARRDSERRLGALFPGLSPEAAEAKLFEIAEKTRAREKARSEAER